MAVAQNRIYAKDKQNRAAAPKQQRPDTVIATDSFRDPVIANIRA
jgi:hypothetical protein